MNQQYYVMHGQNVYGPVSAGQLKQWATDGHLSPDQQVSLDGKEWLAAHAVPDLFPVAVPNAPPPWTPAPVATPMPSSSTSQTPTTADIGQAASPQAPAKDWKREWITTDTAKTPAASAPSPQSSPSASEAKPDFSIPGGRGNPQFDNSASNKPPALPTAGVATFGQVSIDLDASAPVPPSAFPAQTLEAATFGRVNINLDAFPASTKPAMESSFGVSGTPALSDPRRQIPTWDKESLNAGQAKMSTTVLSPQNPTAPNKPSELGSFWSKACGTIVIACMTLHYRGIDWLVTVIVIIMIIAGIISGVISGFKHRSSIALLSIGISVIGCVLFNVFLRLVAHWIREYRLMD